MPQPKDDQPVGLRRGLGVWLLTFYGIGTIVGGGFYALTGKVADDAGMLTPVALALAGIIAAFSAVSFSELSARYPFSAGEAHFVDQAFGRPRLASLTGWMVVATGVVSAATLALSSMCQSMRTPGSRVKNTWSAQGWPASTSSSLVHGRMRS